MPYNWNKYNKPKRNTRTDHQPGHRMEYERNRRKILAAQEVCALCGQLVDKTLKYPHPYSATVDHIIPVSKGGHPSDLNNLQLAHLRCNLLKKDKLQQEKAPPGKPGAGTVNTLGNRELPLSIDWGRYRATEGGSNSEELAKDMESLQAKGLSLYADRMDKAAKKLHTK